MNPSERIRAALLKSETSRQTTASPTLEPPAEVETTLPLVTASDEDRAALSVKEDPPARPPKRDNTKAIETRPAPAPAKAEKASNGIRRTPLIIGGVVVIAGLAAFLLRDRWLPIHTAPKPALAARVLQVDVETAGVGLVKVRWNPQSTPVAQAREGRLVISEDNQPPRTVSLAPDQLKIGHLDYQSTAERIEFRLEVVDRSGALAKESVLALAPKQNAAPQTEVTPAQPQQTAAKVDAKLNPPPVEKASETPAPSRPAPREFTPPPTTTQRPAEDIRTVVLDAPENVPVAGVAVKPIAGLDKIPSIPAPQAQQPSAVQPPTVGGNLQEPKLMKRVAPVYPQLARSLRVEGAVRFTATVRKDGTVGGLQLVSGHKMLVQAATDAVKQWVYRPAILNGRAVEVTTQIDVKFTLNER